MKGIDPAVVADVLALLWFLGCWVGYSRYAKHRSATEVCLASVMHMYRREWMMQMMHRENRMADMSAISTLERNVSFFASSALVILAGVLTLLGYLDQAIVLFDDLPLAGEQTRLQWEAKVALLVVIFVYAFFKFTWGGDFRLRLLQVHLESATGRICCCADRCCAQPGHGRCRRRGDPPGR